MVAKDSHKQDTKDGEAKATTQKQIANASSISPSQKIAALHQENQGNSTEGADSTDDIYCKGD
jgi:hypothetical protein